MPDGSIVAEHQNPAVPPSLLYEIWKMRSEAVSVKDVIQLLRIRTVPAGNRFNTWKWG